MGRTMSSQGKRDNIAALGFSHVVRPLVKAADPVSWIIFVLFVALSVISIVFFVTAPTAVAPDAAAAVEYGAASKYDRYFLAFWYGAWGLLVLSTIGPIFNIARERKETPLSVLIGVGVAHLITFIAVSVIVLVHYDRPDAVTGLMAAFAAAIMVGIGWVVQHQSSARASRRAHTFNILMQSRLSREFQEQLEKRCDYYYAGVVVTPVDAPLSTRDGLVERELSIESNRKRDLALAKFGAATKVNNRYDSELAEVRKKYHSLQGVKYLLNFYEFMSAGISQRELDDELLKATVYGIVRGLYEDTVNVRSHIRKLQPSVFCELDKVMNGLWK